MRSKLGQSFGEELCSPCGPMRVCVYVCVHARTRVCMHTCVPTCESQVSTLGIIPQVPPTSFFEAGSLTDQNLPSRLTWVTTEPQESSGLPTPWC